MTDAISIILTGGTVDSIDTFVNYDKVSEKSGVGTYLDTLKLHTECSFSNVCAKDSRELNDDDRKEILEAIKNADNDRVLVMHGTYTMGETARYLLKHVESIKGKTVVLIGSMTPLEGFWRTDASFNLGFAISSLSNEEPGVYIAMNGRVFKGDEVEKNVKKMRFELTEDIPESDLYKPENSN